MIDALFTPRRCILFTGIGEYIRERRKIFLSKKCWHTFKGYAYSQLHKIRTKGYPTNPKRIESVERYGYDVKFAYHVVRLADEVEQILAEGDLDLGLSRERLKSIRRGEWTIEDIETYFQNAEARLQKLYIESDAVPFKPREQEIKDLLITALEYHYGSLNNVMANASSDRIKLQQIAKILEG